MNKNKIDSVPFSVLSALRNRGHNDESIENMTPEDMFAEYCEWHGLINYGPTLWRLMRNLTRKMDKKGNLRNTVQEIV